MVAIRRNPFSIQRLDRMNATVAASILFILATIYSLGGDAGSYGSVAVTSSVYPQTAGSGSLESMSKWRNQLRSACEMFVHTIQGNITEAHLQQKEEIEASALKRLHVPDPDALHHVPKLQPYKFCKHVLIDLGTNRGDTIAAAVDAALDVCSPIFLEADRTIKKAYRMSRNFPHPHFDAVDLRLHAKGFKAFGLATRLQKFFGVTMDEICVYGMEGNPHFTGHLQKLEAIVSAMNPRPLKHLHIHTETVVSPSDGPTTLYVDQTSEKDHVSGDLKAIR
jgi:hypothetical protein